MARCNSWNLILLGTFSLLGACTPLPAPTLDPASLAPLAGFTPFQTEVAPAAEQILALDPALASYLDLHVAPVRSPRQRADQLLRVLFTPAGLNLSYRYSDTLTAAQAYLQGSGNCLSISNLVVTAARHVGLQAYFQEVHVEPNWKAVGSVLFMDRHVNVRIINLGSGMDYEVDLQPYPTSRSRQRQLMADEAAFAHFYNNRGGEAMARQEDGLAFAYFRRALQSDPGQAFIWANLAALYSRHEQYGEAEALLLAALALNPREYTALSNLAGLYRRTGQMAKAAVYDEAVEKIRQSNPYYLASLAAQAYARQDYAEALRRIKQSLARNPQEPDFHLLAARTYLRLAQPESARRHLQQARPVDAGEQVRSRSGAVY